MGPYCATAAASFETHSATAVFLIALVIGGNWGVGAWAKEESSGQEGT